MDEERKRGRDEERKRWMKRGRGEKVKRWMKRGREEERK